MNIIIDTKGQLDLRDKSRLVESDDDCPEFENNEINDNGLQILGTIAREFLKQAESEKIQKIKKPAHNDIDLDEFERDMGWNNDINPVPQDSDNIAKLTNEVAPIDNILKKSVIQPGFEQLESVPSLRENKRLARAKRIEERNKTKGKEWFNLPAPEVTDEIKHDLEVIQMRSALDPKHFYKKNDLKVLPKYFQIGKVIDSPVDYYSNRLTKKERKNTIVEELMADAEFSKYNKRKYKEIIDEKNKRQYKAYKHAKRLKKVNKK
ncbi:hypothetical protein M0802_002160 [Mischocyttarus mexicanus]|nr:hypothetical protein M0802_002160 [Mischocyttarus mexicanus]